MESDSQRAEEAAQKRLGFELGRASVVVRSGYLELLSKEQANLREKNRGKPVNIGATRSLELLGQARKNVTVGRADLEKMERDWERATSRKGRPPIGGAQDD